MSVIGSNESFLTVSKLKELLHYEPWTGDFRWLQDRGGYGGKGEIAGHLHPSGYYKLKIMGRSYSAHRVAWLYMTGGWPKHCIDHINRIKYDNRFCNLRDVTHYENQQNIAQRTTTSVIPGIRIYNKKYLVNISTPQHKIYVGLYNNFEDALFALTDVKSKLHDKPDYSTASAYINGMM